MRYGSRRKTIALVDEIAREYEVNAFPSRRFSSITKLHEAALILKDYDYSSVQKELYLISTVISLTVAYKL